jgi:tRNA threonylcarbamoyladenosine biosynthesis protein TsaE
MNRFPLRLRTGCAEETREVGRILGRDLVPGDLLAFTGDLGSGKTSLIQGISRGVQVPDASCVRSPTFVVLNIYEGRYPLYHLDLYRIDAAEELEEIGYREFFFGEGITVIEWAERVRELLPEDRLMIGMKFLDESRREIVLEPRGSRFDQRWRGWESSLEGFRTVCL